MEICERARVMPSVRFATLTAGNDSSNVCRRELIAYRSVLSFGRDGGGKPKAFVMIDAVAVIMRDGGAERAAGLLSCSLGR